MSKSGRRLYECDECKVKSQHHWVEKNRAARMRCPACGSARLELVSQEAKDDAISLQQVSIVGHPDMTRPRHELNPKRKIT